MPSLTYLNGYSPELQAQARSLLEAGELLPLLESRYPERHEVHSSKALGSYVQALKARHLRSSAPLGQVRFDDRLHLVHQALGLHTTTTRLHGSKLKKRREVRVASLFKRLAPEFLRMIVVHELAHMKHSEHDRDFYRLCNHMEPEYHRYELDLRLYLTAEEWGAQAPIPKAEDLGQSQ